MPARKPFEPKAGELLRHLLRRRRLELGLSINAAAARARIHPQTLMRLESGHAGNPREATLRAMSRALQVPYGVLWFSPGAGPACRRRRTARRRDLSRVRYCESCTDATEGPLLPGEGAHLHVPSDATGMDEVIVIRRLLLETAAEFAAKKLGIKADVESARQARDRLELLVAHSRLATVPGRE